jgi:hypothetical protein
MALMTFNQELVQDISRQAMELNQQISFKNYLLELKYTPISDRLFLKENPLELIRISTRNGTTVFRNFAEKMDKGTLMDFIRNRSFEDGKVIPNQKVHTMVLAIETAKQFLKKNPLLRVVPKSVRKLPDIDMDNGKRMSR